MSRPDRDEVASKWAEVRDARVEEVGEMEAERRRRVDAMVVESEGVARSIERVEREMGCAERGRRGGWMDVVMG